MPFKSCEISIAESGLTPGINMIATLDRLDEGVFLVLSDGTQQLRFETYLASGDRKLLMAVPQSIDPNTNWTLEVRNRTRGAAPTAPLYIGYWGTPLHSA